MPAELRGPAALDGAEDPVLLGRQDVASPVVRAMRSDDVRELEGGTCRRGAGAHASGMAQP